MKTHFMEHSKHTMFLDYILRDALEMLYIHPLNTLLFFSFFSKAHTETCTQTNPERARMCVRVCIVQLETV